METREMSSNKCISCLVEGSEMHSLNEKFDSFMDLNDLLKLCLHFEMPRPYFSTMLCDKCTSLLKEFFNFKMRFMNNQILLKNIISLKEELSECEESIHDNTYLEEDSHSYIECDDKEIIFEIVEEDKTELTVEATDMKEGCSNDFQEENRDEIGCDENINSKQETMSNTLECELEIEDENDGFLEEEQFIASEPTNFKCVICKIYFVSKDYLDVHLFKHRKHVCDICGKKFVKKSYLAEHLIKHKNVKDVICPLCGKAFKSRHTMRAHMVIHTNPRAFVCENCGRPFTHRGALKTHITLKHTKNKDYLCLWCGMKFNLKSSLDKHNLRKHNPNTRTKYHCLECNVEYLDKSNLTRHNRVKHSPNYKVVPCELCNKVFSERSNLLRHIRKKHTGELVESKEDYGRSLKVKVDRYTLTS